jgi:hypothetical protein
MKRAFNIGAIALTFCVLIYWAFSEIYWARYVSADNATTLIQLQNKFISSLPFRKNIEGKSYFILKGPLPPFYILSFPSSHPIYVFDADGRLIDWRRDPGDLSDSDPFMKKWLRKAEQDAAANP